MGREASLPVRLRLHLGFNLFLFSCLISSSGEKETCLKALSWTWTLILMMCSVFRAFRATVTSLGHNSVNYDSSLLLNTAMREKLKLLQYTETILQSFPSANRALGDYWSRSKLGKTIQKSISIDFLPQIYALCELWIGIYKPCETAVTLLISNNWTTFQFGVFSWIL